jgi:hypothetical protein
MLMLGVLGEYLWRTLDESRRRPRYFLQRLGSRLAVATAMAFTRIAVELVQARWSGLTTAHGQASPAHFF